MKTQETAVTGEGNAPREAATETPLSDHIPDLWFIAQHSANWQVILEAWHNAHFIRKQRDELLAALKEIATRPASAEGYDGAKGAASLQGIAMAAIRNAERGQQ